MKKVGLIINPVAGLGGRVGLKGSDGLEVQQRALALGAVARAAERAAMALEALRPLAGELALLTYPGPMGADAARAGGFEPQVIGRIDGGRTTAEDTVRAAAEMAAAGVDLLLFAGGDGTARDVFQGVGTNAVALGKPAVALGIPAGVKIHSAVYGTTPERAGELALLYLQGRVRQLKQAEVMDIDEEGVRQGVVQARLVGYLTIPYRQALVQSRKRGSGGSEREAALAIAAEVEERLEPGRVTILGPGTTTAVVARRLGVAKTLVGVDVVDGGELLLADANEAQLLELLAKRPGQLVVTPIGGQGYLFGRGNQQISPEVIRRVGKAHILVVSAPQKLHELGGRPLLVDTGERAVDEMLAGYIPVITGYGERSMVRVVH